MANWVMSKIDFKKYILLHSSLMIYSLGGIFTKLASTYSFLSKEFVFFYSLSLLILAGYAFLWQLILKKFPLSVAFSNKAVMVIWGMLWGKLIFCESITLGKIVGAILIIFGIVVMNGEEG